MDGDVRVLVVDDDPDIAQYVRTVLTKAGMTAVACFDPLEALALAAREQFDAVVTDIEMPGMNGLEFLGRLRELQTDLPVAVMTAHASVDYAVEALRRNADEFMVKPVRRDDVVSTVRRLVELGASRRATARHQTVLAIGAHPDDVELGIGGTLAAHRSAGDQVVILTLSRGARGGEAGDRMGESMAAAELIVIRHGESLGNAAAAQAYADDAEVIEIDTRDADGRPGPHAARVAEGRLDLVRLVDVRDVLREAEEDRDRDDDEAALAPMAGTLPRRVAGARHGTA